MRRRSDAKIDMEQIVVVAWNLVDAEGLEGLSTRRLASKLEVSGPALYHHVPSMQALYGLMIEQALDAATNEVLPELSWQDWLRAVADSHRRALLAHRDSGQIATLSIPSAGTSEKLIPRWSDTLMKAGFSRHDALATVGSLGSLIIGTVVNEQQEAHRLLAATNIPMQEVFDFALDAIIAGLSTRLERSRASA